MLWTSSISIGKVKMNKRGFLLCILCPIAFAMWAQIKHYSVDNGLATEEIRQVVELPNGQILVNSEGVFEIFDGRTFNTVPCDRRNLYKLKNFSGYYYLWQGDSILWLRDFYHMYMYDARINAFRYDDNDRIESDRLLRRMADGDLRSVPCDSAVARRASDLGIRSHVECALTDRQGGLWVGTVSDGIFYMPPKRPMASAISWTDSLYNVVWGKRDSKGRLWRCTAQGLLCHEGGRVALYSSANVSGFVHDRMMFVLPLTDGSLLLCNHDKRIGYFDAERHTFRPLNQLQSQLAKYRRLVGACQMNEDKIVVYSQNGAFVLDRKNGRLEPFRPEDEILRYSDKYNCIMRDRKGRLWIGTQNGLFLYDGKSTRRFSKENGMSNNCVRSIVEDADGKIWVGTSVEVTCVGDGGPVFNLGAADGVADDFVLEGGAVLLPDGRVAIAKQGGLTLISPGDFKSVAKPVDVVLTELEINDKQHETAKPLVLAHGQNYVTFTFSALDYARPEHTRYRYRMEGLDKSWSYIYANDGNGTAHYTSLHPGHYVMQVQACEYGGAWGRPLLVDITILPPWWLTWWAKLVYAMAFVAVMAFGLRLYVKRKRKMLEKANEAKVNQLFELREEARQQFAKNVKVDPHKIGICKEEEDLVRAMMKAIESNMDNTEYTVDKLASDIALSRSNLYRRTQTILGITPSDFIRNVRLKHAAYLLAETELPINQVAVSVGFASSSHFSQCFKKMFGVLPSEYKNSGSGALQ